MSIRLFTDRDGGVSRGRYSSFNLSDQVGDVLADVIQNRGKLASLSGSTVFMDQTHGDMAIVVDGIPGATPKADALITQEKGIALAVLVADCIPVLFWDEPGSVVAAVHVGRRGLVNGIAPKVVEILMSMGARNIFAEFGPAICGACYEVGEDVFNEVVSMHPGAAYKSSKFSFALNLPGALAIALNKVGVSVISSTICTAESQEHFSFRRDGITGRAAGVISL